MSVNEKMTAIADNIREKTGGTEMLTLDEVASGVNEVYEAGKRKEWSDFWDVFQNYGARRNYENAFHKGMSSDPSRWNDINFKPKYDLKPRNSAKSMFFGCLFTDFKGVFERQGVVFDTSSVTNCDGMFESCTVLTRLPVLDFSNCKRIYTVFQFCNSLISIDKLIIGNSSHDTLFSCFNACYALQDVQIEGTIDINFSFKYSKNLSVESQKSAITHLKDYSGTDSEYTYTITFKATAFEKLEAEGNTSPNGNTWTEYIDDLKWNLTLA